MIGYYYYVIMLFKTKTFSSQASEMRIFAGFCHLRYNNVLFLGLRMLFRQNEQCKYVNFQLLGNPDRLWLIIKLASLSFIQILNSLWRSSTDLAACVMLFYV